ncbi:MAG TPA: ThuA domain-containing protein [Bryobacterales bacterium]|nr:ThuA domain-containing protein [Bryobacterales bacterium]
MRHRAGFLTAAIVVFLAFACLAQGPRAQKKSDSLKHLLVIGDSEGWTHDSISHAMVTLGKIGAESGLFDVTLRTDVRLITKKPIAPPVRNAKNLDYFDAILFYTTGELPLDDSQKADFLSFVRDDGKGFLGTHSATDTLYEWPAYGELIGAYFDQHPWHQEVRVNVEDHTFSATRHFPASIALNDEIYQFRNFSRERVRVLMSLDTSSVDLTNKNVHRRDKDFAVAWARTYGKGRVFYCSLGHENAVWDRPDMQKMWLEAVRWAMGLTPGDATPRPKRGD